MDGVGTGCLHSVFLSGSLLNVWQSSGGIGSRPPLLPPPPPPPPLLQALNHRRHHHHNCRARPHLTTLANKNTNRNKLSACLFVSLSLSLSISLLGVHPRLLPVSSSQPAERWNHTAHCEPRTPKVCFARGPAPQPFPRDPTSPKRGWKSWLDYLSASLSNARGNGTCQYSVTTIARCSAKSYAKNRSCIRLGLDNSLSANPSEATAFSCILACCGSGLETTTLESIADQGRWAQCLPALNVAVVALTIPNHSNSSSNIMLLPRRFSSAKRQHGSTSRDSLQKKL